MYLLKGRYVCLCGERRVLIRSKKQHMLARVLRTNEFSVGSDIFFPSNLNKTSSVIQKPIFVLEFLILGVRRRIADEESGYL